jgi:uncharacterized protein YciI
MLFVITAQDKPGGGALRATTRSAHFDYVRATGTVKLGGPFLGPDGAMVGSLIIFEAQDLDAAKAWAANDPYAKAGLFAEVELRPWKATFNECGAAL